MSLLKEKLELQVETTELKAEAAFKGFPTASKWIIGIGMILLIPAYFLIRFASSQFWQARYEAENLTARPSFTEAKELKPQSITIFSQNGNISALVALFNENLELSLSETPFQVNFYNQRQEIIYTAQDKLYLLPNQKKYLLIPKIQASEKPVSAAFSLQQPPAWKKKSSLPKVNLVTTLPQTSQQSSPQAFAAETSVYNQSPYRISKVRLTFLVFGRNSELLNASQRDEFSLAPFERRTFKQLWPQFIAPVGSRVEVSAETDLLSPSNLALESQATSPASDLNKSEPEDEF